MAIVDFIVIKSPGPGLLTNTRGTCRFTISYAATEIEQKKSCSRGAEVHSACWVETTTPAALYAYEFLMIFDIDHCSTINLGHWSCRANCKGELCDGLT